jgi:hypothetical protein
MTESFLATATRALPLPDRLAMACPQSFKLEALLSRVRITTAASYDRVRASVSPHLGSFASPAPPIYCSCIRTDSAPDPRRPPRLVAPGFGDHRKLNRTRTRPCSGNGSGRVQNLLRPRPRNHRCEVQGGLLGRTAVLALMRLRCRLDLERRRFITTVSQACPLSSKPRGMRVKT